MVVAVQMHEFSYSDFIFYIFSHCAAQSYHIPTFSPLYVNRESTVGDGHSSELHHCKCLLE